MGQSSREIVKQALEFDYPQRLPRELWTLPWAENNFPEVLEEIERRFPSDICRAPDIYEPSPKVVGQWYTAGEYTDEWGCIFTNIAEGIMGEVRNPIISDIKDWSKVEPPYDVLPKNTASAIKKVDELMNVICPKKKTGNLAHLIFRKSEPRGTEFICVACAETGVFLFLEVKRGRKGMFDSEFQK